MFEVVVRQNAVVLVQVVGGLCFFCLVYGFFFGQLSLNVCSGFWCFLVESFSLFVYFAQLILDTHLLAFVKSHQKRLPKNCIIFVFDQSNEIVKHFIRIFFCFHIFSIHLEVLSCLLVQESFLLVVLRSLLETDEFAEKIAELLVKSIFVICETVKCFWFRFEMFAKLIDALLLFFGSLLMGLFHDWQKAAFKSVKVHYILDVNELRKCIFVEF